MKILVIGGSGYMGSELVRALSDVTVWDNLRFGNNLPKGVKVVEEDIRDHSYALPLYIKEADVVIHLAATSKEPTSLYNTQYCIDTNYCATKDIVRYCKETGTKLIYASSCSVYFSYDIIKNPGLSKEDDVLNPISPYSITKYASEQCIREELDDYVILRPGTHYGVSPRMRLDLVVNAMMSSALTQGTIMYKKGIYRQLVDIQTMVQAYIQSFDLQGTYNVFDFNVSLKDLAERVQQTAYAEIEGVDTEVERNYRASREKMDKDFDIERRPFGEALKEIREWVETHDTTKDKYYNARQ